MPAAILIAVFSFVAMTYSLFLSFHKWDVLTPVMPFVGLANYQRALSSPLFWTAMQNTTVFVVFRVPGTIILALVLALLAEEVTRGKLIYRTVYFLPSVTPTVVLSLIWMWLYRSDGVINIALGALGLPQPNWLMSTEFAMPAIIIFSIWESVGYQMVIFMAGLADIPTDFYEAAYLDGATKLQRIWYITLPLLRNSFIFVTVTSIVGAFQVFTQAFIMTQGGPINATTTIAMLIYETGMKFLQMGYAAALSWLLFIVVFVFVIIQMQIVRSRQLY